MKRRLMLFLMCMASAVLAELPPDVDEVLFDLTHGTNYVQWVASTGVVKYVRNFGPFDGGRLGRMSMRKIRSDCDMRLPWNANFQIL